MPITIEAREYKILLKPGALGAVPDGDRARSFFEDLIRPVVDGVAKIEAEGAFDDGFVRDIRFFETKGRLLRKSGFALRLRTKEGKQEATLKLRLADLFVASGTALPGRKSEDGGQQQNREEFETKFEEDIAPLEARRDGLLTVASPPSIRSRFSRSTSQDFEGQLATLGDAFELYPTLKDVLAEDGARFTGTDPLVAGPRIREIVFKGLTVDLGKAADAKLALTWWEFLDAAEPPNIAEISYKVTTKEGAMDLDAARRGLRLFKDLQARLDEKGWLDLEHPSKTELALPPDA